MNDSEVAFNSTSLCQEGDDRIEASLLVTYPSTAAAAAAAGREASEAIAARSSDDNSKQCQLPVVYKASSVTSTAPLPWKPSSAIATRSSEAREVHHVTFAEPCNKYVHSDSGIVLSPDDSDFNDATAGDGQLELTDEESGDAEGGDEMTDDCPARLPPINANAVPGPPIIKLLRSRSTDSHDNPFLFDGELHRKADYIITHSTFLRSYIRISDPDLNPVEQNTNEAIFNQVTENDPDELKISDPTQRPTTDVAQNDISCDSPAVTRQQLASKAQAAVVRNGEAEEPLLACKKEGNGLEISRKPTKSKKGNCCLVQ